MRNFIVNLIILHYASLLKCISFQLLAMGVILHLFKQISIRIFIETMYMKLHRENKPINITYGDVIDIAFIQTTYLNVSLSSYLHWE